MKRSSHPKISPTEQRKVQINHEIDKIQEKLKTTTRKQFKAPDGLDKWQRHQQRKLAELESELSILNDPGEYEELPIAVIAEELGISINEVASMIRGCELEPSDMAEGSRNDRVMRAELERALDIGIEEMLRLSHQESAEIFEEAIPYFHSGDIERAEKAHRRIEARSVARFIRPSNRNRALPD